MTERLHREQVTRAFIAATKTSEGVISGVNLIKSGQREPYLIMSLYLPQFDSIRQSLFYICGKVIRHADRDTALIIYQGVIPAFDEWYTFESRLGPVAEVYGIDIRFRYDKRVQRQAELVALANDSLKRKNSIVHTL